MVRKPRIKMINRYGNTIPTRVPSNFLNGLRGALIDRSKNGLSKSPRERTDTEGFRLLMRTNGLKNALDEIRKRPKWEDIL